MLTRIYLIVAIVATIAAAQSKDAYTTEGSSKSGLFLDPSRLSVQNSLSFGAMSGGSTSSLQSQSLYTTMMRYQFAAPVTLNLNFSLPIHSTFSSIQNLSSTNLQSMDYFKSIPFEMSLAWQPTKNTVFQFSMIKMPSNYFPGYSAFGPTWDRPYYRPWEPQPHPAVEQLPKSAAK